MFNQLPFFAVCFACGFAVGYASGWLVALLFAGVDITREPPIMGALIAARERYIEGERRRFEETNRENDHV